jgi:hypothetical protein
LPYNKITCKTFCNRAFSCSFYSEENNYAKIINAFFIKVIKKYKDSCNNNSTNDFYSFFVNEFKRQRFHGLKYIYNADKIQFTTLCYTCASHFNNFIKKYHVTNLLDTYVYSQITGIIGGTVTIDKEYIVDFSFYDSIDTYYRLYYNRFNAFLYNKVKNTKKDLLIFLIRENNFYLIKYNELDYTIRKGFIGCSRKRKAHVPSLMCMTCKIKNCKPRFLTLERLI